jgi:hypothetical protein
MPETVRTREFTVSLPIGLTDPQGNHQREIVLRKMTGREEAILADRRYQKNGGRLVTELLHSCIVRVGDLPKNGASTVSSMYSVDRNYLLLKLRSITFGPELNTNYTCPSCAEMVKLVENLDELPVRTLADDETADEIHVELQDGYLDRDGDVHTSMSLRLPTGADEEAVAPQMRQNPSEGKNALLSRCLKSLGTMQKHRMEALSTHIMSELTLADRRLVDRALNQAAPGVNLVRKIECASCGHVFSASLDLSHFLALE